MRKDPIIPQELAASRIKDALQLRVGRGKRFSFSSLSDATGIPTRTLESYVQGSSPQLGAFLSLCGALGPSFTSDVLSACGQSAQHSNCDDPEHMKVLGALGALVSQISEALADGHVDHREAAALRPHAAALLDMLEPLARNEPPQTLKASGVVS